MKNCDAVVDAPGKELASNKVLAYHGDVNLNKEKRPVSGKTGKGGAYSIAIDIQIFKSAIGLPR